MLITIPLYSSTSTFCPIGKFCKVTTFSGIMQGKFLVCRTTDNRLRTTDFWAVADGFKTTSQRLYKTTSRAVAVLTFDFRLLSFTLCRLTMKSTRSLVVFWTCSLQLKTMRFTGRKYGSYGSKLWHLGCVSMGVLDFAYASQDYGQRSTDNGPLGGSRL